MTDFTTAGGDELSFRRYYNSQSNRYSSLGFRWRSNFDRQLDFLGVKPANATTLLVIRTDGAIYTFTKSNGVWKSASSDVDGTLTTDGSTVWTYIGRNDDVETYDFSTGRLTSVATPSGYQQNLTYNASGYLSAVTDSFNRTLTFTFSGSTVSTLTAPDGSVYSYSYDIVQLSHNDRLKQVTYPGTGSPTVQYRYENTTYPFALTGIVDQNGLRYATWAYDANMRANFSQHGSNAETSTLSYSLSGGTGTVTVTNALGKVFVYKVGYVSGPGVGKVTEIDQQASANTPAAVLKRTYNTAGYLASRTDNNGNVTQYQRNSRGLETSRTEAYGTSLARTITTTWSSTFHVPTEIVQPNLTTDYTYDSYGKLTRLEQTDTTTQSVPYSTSGQTRIWGYSYTSSGELATVTGPLGTGDTVTYTYNADGSLATITNELNQVTTINTVNGRGQPTEMTDPNGIQTDLAYDAMGRLTTVTVNPGSSQAVTSITYDAVGDITQIVRPDSSYLAYTYDDARRVTSGKDNLGDEIDYTYNYASSVTAANVKNSLGTIVKSLSKTYDELNRVLTQVGANSQTTAFGYDKDDNITSVTDPRSKLYSNAFDALNRLTQNTDPDSYTTQSAYNAKDDVTSVTDERSLQTSYVRDGFGDAIQQTSPDTGTTTFWFDAGGRMTKKVDASSVETDYTYDFLGRMLTKTFPASSGEDVTYSYDSTSGGNDGIGHLTSITDASGSTSFTYNALGQVIADSRVIQGVTYTSGYTYDAAGHVLQITYPSGRIVTYTRDSVGHITQVTTQANSSAPTENVVTGATYNPFGPLLGFTFGNSVALTLTYDQDYELSTLQSSLGTTTIQNLGYGYDAAGNITSITDNYQSARSQTLGYDDLNRLNSASGAYGSLSFTYDGVGNRATSTSGGTTQTYNYGSTSNQLTSISVSGTTTRTFTYANSGQVSQDARGGSTTYTFTYDNDGRIASAALNGSTVGTYAYNGVEQRVAKTTSTSTHDVYDRFGHLMSEDDGSGNLIREYIWLDDLPVALVDNTGMSPVTYYIHTDQVGRPQKMTDGSANLVWDAVYDPFGNVTSLSGTATNLLMFPGQLYDSETALAQNWNREYDPTLGRYIQSDPVGLNGGINTYAYASSNPGIHVDPKGEGWIGDAIWGAFIAGVVADMIANIQDDANPQDPPPPPIVPPLMAPNPHGVCVAPPPPPPPPWFPSFPLSSASPSGQSLSSTPSAGGANYIPKSPSDNDEVE